MVKKGGVVQVTLLKLRIALAIKTLSIPVKAVELSKLDKGRLKQNQHRGHEGQRSKPWSTKHTACGSELPLDSFAEALRVRVGKC